MKKLVIVFLAMLVIGCGKDKVVPSSQQLSDSSIMVLDGSHAVIYNTVTGEDEIVEVCRDIPDGTVKVTDQGDTLYWLGGDTMGQGEYIPANKWKAYCREMEEFYKEYGCKEQEKFYKKYR